MNGKHINREGIPHYRLSEKARLDAVINITPEIRVGYSKDYERNVEMPD